jgi:hypothetical protein
MKSRAWKYAALAASGSVLLQLSGCVEIAAQTALSFLFRAVVSGIFDALAGTTATA